MKKIILHLCSHTGSDSHYYDLDDDYTVIKVGIDIGVQNFSPEYPIYGVIGNPVCTNFSMAGGVVRTEEELDEGMFLVNECLRVIEECKALGGLKFWVLENPARGVLHKRIGQPKYKYQPWEYGSSWTKHTALWGDFNMPEKIVKNRADVVIREGLYIRSRDTLPSLVLMHKSAIEFMPEYEWCKEDINNDSDIRSLCSDGFAKGLYESNR